MREQGGWRPQAEPAHQGQDPGWLPGCTQTLTHQLQHLGAGLCKAPQSRGHRPPPLAWEPTALPQFRGGPQGLRLVSRQGSWALPTCSSPHSALPGLEHAELLGSVSTRSTLLPHALKLPPKSSLSPLRLPLFKGVFQTFKESKNDVTKDNPQGKPHNEVEHYECARQLLFKCQASPVRQRSSCRQKPWLP